MDAGITALLILILSQSVLCKAHHGFELITFLETLNALNANFVDLKGPPLGVGAVM